MHKRCLRVLSALLVSGAAIPALSQVVPPTQGGTLPFRVGAGYSIYASDWLNGAGGNIGGPSVWIDFDIPKSPPALSGFQIEAEGRDLNYDRTGIDPGLRQYTFAGGVNYAWRYDPVFHPYLKFLAGIGNLDFARGSQIPGYRKDSRAFYAPAIGLDVRVHERLWMRGNYEYQFWPHFFQGNTMTPHGFTLGMFYDFSKYALRQYHPW